MIALLALQSEIGVDKVAFRASETPLGHWAV